jgi:hypothetical protein
MAAVKVRRKVLVKGLDVDSHASEMVRDRQKNQSGQGRQKVTDRKKNKGRGRKKQRNVDKKEWKMKK